MADLKAVAQAMTFMGQVTNFTSPTNIPYVGAKWKDVQWLVSYSNNCYLFTKRGKYLILCEGTAAPIIECLKIIEKGNLNPTPNQAAANLQRVMDAIQVHAEKKH